MFCQRLCLHGILKPSNGYKNSRFGSTKSASSFLSAEESNFTRYTGIAFFSTIIVGTAYLGVWQLERYFWKVDLIEKRKSQLLEKIYDLPLKIIAQDVAISKEEDQEFRQFKVHGKFQPNSTFYLYPRSAPAESTDHVATPKSGGYLYSLLRRENGTPVIVNRGWLPRKLLDIHMVGDHHEEEGEVSLVGVLRRGEEKGGFSPDNDIKARHFFWLDHAGIAKAMGYNEEDLPVIMDVIKPKDESSEVTLMNPLKKKIENYIEFYMTPEKHAGYAATWFSFSIASAIMMYIRFRRTKKVTKTY